MAECGALSGPEVQRGPGSGTLAQTYSPNTTPNNQVRARRRRRRERPCRTVRDTVERESGGG